ncbi:DUF3274 domain-containing protein [Variovorax humicola]|uniref:DUF3274 domain-containing protein n=1 Tax=Variovorax humicola TaxID=1769758 RepID=A0ABU8VWF4_9BURK
MSDLSKLDPVAFDQGKGQWVEGVMTGIDRDNPVRTHTVGIPHLMPGTIIFVHGVNSDGEWYRDAAGQFARGLNTRLGRDDLEQLEADLSKKRFLRYNKDGTRARSPIIPFYWGYCASPEDVRCWVDRPDVIVDRYGNALRKDSSWGGGPFQNGTGDLSPFWHREGFRREVFFDLFDINLINSIEGRTLLDCPDRLYYVHAARRLANLVRTIRTDLPNEPINIIAHSQGTMIALCSLFYLDGVRSPDTLILNSSPYRFDTGITDYLAAAGGTQKVASTEARVATFAKAAEIMQKAKDEFNYTPAPKTECTHQPVHRHKYDDKIFVHQPPDNPDWKAEIGARDIDREGRKWWQDRQRDRDNRGKLFVNFDPGDRVIGVSVVEGIGWRGIPSRYLDEGKSAFGPNVMQRMFARGSNEENNPPVGSRTNFKMAYFYTQIDRQRVQSEYGLTWTTGSGEPLQAAVTENWRYLDGGSASGFWYVASEKTLGLIPAMGSIRPPGDGGRSEYVWINAPKVPEGAKLDKDFDGKLIRYDGQADLERGIEADPEQQEDFKDRVNYEKRDASSCMPQEIQCVDEKGFKTKRLETTEEVEIRLREAVGHKLVSPTNHSQILRYGIGGRNGPVERVLSYDLTVGQGYAWGHQEYWEYLLNLADWKKSDPYYFGEQLEEKHDDIPPGIVTATAPADDRPAPRRVGAEKAASGGMR